MNTKKSKKDTVDVVLSCIYSGVGESWGVGETVSVAKEEADRLVSLGVAEIVG
jgi:hypothetical protein